MKKLTASNPVVQKLEKYFNTLGVEHTIEAVNYGSFIYANIHYQNFKPEKEVVADLKKLASNLKLDLFRYFSKEVLCEEFMNLVRKDASIFFINKDGIAQEALLGEYVEMGLLNKTV